MGRIEKICSFIDPCREFADVGCDHGYCTRYVLDNGLCERAIISDVSQKCLQKAEKLLAEYIRSGRCSSVCCNGLDIIPRSVDGVLIAGMGGEEIIGILSRGFIPQKFVLQPMKNAEHLRSFLIENGCAITRDDVFCDDGKYYFIIKGENCGGTSPYSDLELEFGRDSLNNPVLKEYAAIELRKKRTYLNGCPTGTDDDKLRKSVRLLTEVLTRES